MGQLVKGAYGFIELHGLVHLAGEAIDEETALSVNPAFTLGFGVELGFHCVLQQLDCDLHRDDGALSDACPDEVAVLGPLPRLLSSQKVSG